MKYLTSAALAALLALAPAIQASAESKRAAPVNPATHHHGLPGNNPGFGGRSANPKGVGKNGGGGIHGIANVPGHNRDNHPRNGKPGFRDQLNTVHGGLGGGGH